MLIAGSLGLVEGRPSWRHNTQAQWADAYRLELWLCSLALIFLLAFVVLSLLPSSFANDGSYNKNKGFLFTPDWRFWFLVIFCSVRVGAISLHRSSVNLLDGLNLAALSYAACLLLLVGFESHKYLTLPVQWVTVLDLGFAWTCWINPVLQQRSSARWAGALGSAIVLSSSGIDHLQHPNFAASVSKIKVKQQSWLEAYNAIDAISAPMRTRGEAIHLVYHKSSWFSANVI